MTPSEYQIAIYSGKICPYCKSQTEYVSSAEAYEGIHYGMIYLCRSCDAWVGVHKGTDTALGRLANKELRYWKKEAHRWFDPIAIHGLINQVWPEYVEDITNRKKAYLWLSKKMDKDFEFTHIGMFDVEDCKLVVDICKPIVEKLTDSDDFYLPY